MDSIKDSTLDEKTQAIENAKRIIIDTTNTLSDRELKRALNASESAYPKVYKPLNLKDKGLNVEVNAEMLGMNEEEKLVFKMVDSLFGFKQSLLSAKTDRALKTLAENLSISTKPLTEAINNIAGTLAVEFRFPNNIIIPNFGKVMPNNAFTDTINHLSEQLSALNDQLKKTIGDSLGDIKATQNEDSTPSEKPKLNAKYDGMFLATSKPYNLLEEEGVVNGGTYLVSVFSKYSKYHDVVVKMKVKAPNGATKLTPDQRLLMDAWHSLWKVSRGEKIYPINVAYMMYQQDPRSGVSRERLDWIVQATAELMEWMATLEATAEVQIKNEDKTLTFERTEAMLPIVAEVARVNGEATGVVYRFRGVADKDEPVYFAHAEMTRQVIKTNREDYQIEDKSDKAKSGKATKDKKAEEWNETINKLIRRIHQMVDPKTKRLKVLDKRTGKTASRRILISTILEEMEIDPKDRLAKSRYIKGIFIPALRHLVYDNHKYWSDHFLENRGNHNALESVDIYFQGEVEKISANETEKSQNERSKDV